MEKINKKREAIQLRYKGRSIRYIERTLNIPRSTLSGWFRGIELSDKQKEVLNKRWLAGLKIARVRAAKVHRENRIARVNDIKLKAKKDMQNIIIDKSWGELIFSTFYLAEGTKRENSVIIANTNPKVLKAFINLFRYLYNPNESRFRCCLHLRKDQGEEQMKDYWSRKLDIPKKNFIKTQFDKRTNKPSFSDYKGVCVLIYMDLSIQRRVLCMGEELLNKLYKVDPGV